MPHTYRVDRTDRCKSSYAGEFFKGLPPQALADFEAMSIRQTFEAREVLFEEKQNPSRVFVLLEGQVKLSMNSIDGRRLILRIAGPGELPGLTAVLSGKEYEMTAEALHPCKVASVRRHDFLEFLLRYPVAYASVAHDLSIGYTRACEQLRTVGLAPSAPVKLARLLLELCAAADTPNHSNQFKLTLTHGEIGECIGASRETVTRTLSEFKSRHLLDFRGSTLLIHNQMALASYAEV
ncbi:MAG: Crp/Fnr family transcriptional regulator [Acidobacteriota bacterium]